MAGRLPLRVNGGMTCGCFGDFGGPGLSNPGLLWMPEPDASKLAVAANSPGT